MYRQQFHVSDNQLRPDDITWTGAEIRSCCRLPRSRRGDATGVGSASSDELSFDGDAGDGGGGRRLLAGQPGDGGSGSAEVHGAESGVTTDLVSGDRGRGRDRAGTSFFYLLGARLRMVCLFGHAMRFHEPGG